MDAPGMRADPIMHTHWMDDCSLHIKFSAADKNMNDCAKPVYELVTLCVDKGAFEGGRGK